MASNKESRKIVLRNIPSSYDAELVKDYIEGTLDIDVMEVHISPYIQGRALVTLKDDLKDLSDAAQLVANSPIEGNEVILLETYRKSAIVVNELNIEMLSEEFLKLYLENTFADGDEVIENSQTWPDYHLAAVHFSSEHQHVVDDILVESDHTPLPSEDYHIKISHFYCNFHEFIGQQSHENTSSVKNTQKAIVPPLGKNNHSNPNETEDNESDSSTEDNEEDANVGDEDSKSEDDDDDNDDNDDNDDKSGSEGESSYTESENDNSFGKKTKKTGVEGQNESDGTSMRGRHKKNEASQLVNAVPKYKDIQSFSDDDKEETIPKFNVIRGRGRVNIRCKSSGPVSKENFSRGGLPNQVNRSRAPVPSWRGGTAHIFRGGNSRNCRGLGQLTNMDSNDWSKQSYNSNSGIDSNRNDTFTHPIPRGQWCRDDYVQPQSSPGVRNLTLQSWNSESDVGYNRNGSLFSSRGGTSGRGSAYVWRKSGMPTEKNIRKTSLQEERFRDGGKEFLKRSHTVADDMSEASENSKTLLQRNETKVFHSQSGSFEKHTEELLKQKEEEKAKLQELSKNVRATMEMTVLQETFLNPLYRAFSDCTIYFDGNKKELVLFGTQGAITDCQMKLMLEMKKLKEDNLKISSDMQSILSRDKGKQYLKDLNSSGLKGAMVEMDNDLLLIAAKEESILSEATKMLRTKLDVSETIKSEVKIPVDRLTSIKYAIEHSLLVSVSFNESEKTIQLTGVEDDVQMARRDVEKLLEEFGVFEKSFNVGEPFARFFHLCLNDRIKFILKSVEVTDFISTETKNSIRFKGSQTETRLVLRNLDDLKNNVISKTWNLLNDFNFKAHEIFLIAKSVKTGQMKEKIDTYKYKDKCLVTLKVPDFALQMISSKHKKPSGKTKMSKYRVSSPVSKSEPSRPSLQNKLVFDISNTCQLIIKPYGDITKEKSQVLVSVLGPDMDMRKTRVGGTFNKAFPSHWKELKVAQDSNPDAPVLTVPNPKGLKCLAVCHVILAPWNPSTSLQQLSVAVQTVINQAKAIGAKSISFPALGCGRAFQFPPSNVAQQVLSSIQAGNVSNFLTKVTLLAPDIELFKELKTATPQYFNAAVPKSNLAIAPPVPITQVFQNEESEDETGDSESSDDMLDSNSLIDSKNNSFAQINITTLHGDSNVESMKNTIAKDIRETCLQVDKFSQNLLDHWSKESRQKIMKEAIRLSVWVERSSNPKTKKVRFDLTGEKHAVIEMKSFIRQEYLEESSHLPKKRLTSDNMPRRGTVDFLRYAADSDELFPSYWSLNKSKSFLKSLGNALQRKKCKNLVSVDKDIKDAITKLVAQTIDLNLVGHGNDAAGIQYQNLKVIDVKRVENPDQFELYRTQRKRLFEKMASRGHICQDIGKLPGSKGRVVTTELLSDSMKKELYYEINEHYLFHGTKSDTVEALIHNGLDPRLSNEAAMFGKGIYAAEKATKSDQYADSRAKREPNGTKLTLILTRMLLGDIFLCDDKHKSVQGKATKKLSRPPCIKCLEDICKCKNQTLFDSVMGDGKWLFREFVVYESARCYPEYVITYQRV